MPDETVETPVESSIPEDDYAAYESWAAQQGMQPNSVERSDDDVEVDETASEPEEAAEEAEPAGETAAESETAEPEQEEETEEEETEETDEEPEPKGGRGVQKRISKLTKEIRELKAKLAEKPEAEPEPAAPKSVEKPKDDGKPVAPKLADFESYELYEAAHAEFVEKLTDWKAGQLENQRKADDEKKRLEGIQAESNAKWSEAAAEFPDYNEVVGNEEVQISHAMEVVLRTSFDPKVGTAISYYLGKHPEESLRIAKATLAQNELQWGAALARAGIELAKLEDKATVKKTEKPPAPKKEPPKVTAAPKPPAKVSGARPAPTFNVEDGDAAQDYEAWERARNKQLRRR